MDGITHGARELPKRSRAALACNACRKVKSKCDGGRPVCGRCSRQSSECTYTLNVHDRRMDRQEERRAHLALKHKVSELEAKLKQAAAAAPTSTMSSLSSGAANSTASPGSMGSSLHGDSPLPIQLTQPPTTNTLSDEQSRAATNNTPGSAVDALATGAFDHRPAAEIGYFGPTSNHAMFRSVTSAMVNSGYRLSVLRQQDQEGEAAGGPHKHQTHQIQIQPPMHQAPNPRDLPSSMSVAAGEIGVAMRDEMPSQTVARQWVTQFFDTVGSVLPYVNDSAILRDLAMPSFLIGGGPVKKSTSVSTSTSTSTSMPRSTGRRRSRATEGLLNIVFAHALVAMAAQSQPQNSEEAAEPFYHRAVSLVLQDEQAVSTQTTQTVQALLLLGSFQQNSQRAMASLATHALAVKASYQLGLHSPATYDGLSTSDKALRAELWFAVVNQDMILATALGRPCLIPPAYVQYKMLAMLDNASSSSSSTSAESVYYFRHVSSLHQIMGKAVESIYGANIGGLSELEPHEFVSRTMDLVFQLQAWRASIQPFSVWPPSPAPETGQTDMYNWSTSKFQSERYSLCLSVYYYKTMMIVCAPLLMRVLEEVTDSAGSSSSHGAVPGASHSQNHQHSTKPMKTPATSSSSLLLEMAVPVLRKELYAIAAYQSVATSLMHRHTSFFKTNAIWWVCNFNSLTMSLHLFALWLVCKLSDGMSSALDTSVDAVESLLLEAVSILSDIGGTSMMSIKAYHSLQRYMRLARAIAPMRAPASQAGGLQMEHEIITGGLADQNGYQYNSNHGGNSSGSANANPAVPTVIDPQVPINFDELLLHEPHQGALFTGGAFLWDGFPDASMNIVGDMFYQQMEGDFLNNGLQGFQGM